LLRFAQRKSPQTEATLEMDASIVETTKQDTLFSYQGSPSFQPLSVRWAELDLVAHSEFRDGNVPAAYQKVLLIYCAEGQNERFSVIEFAVGVDVTVEFKKVVAAVEEKEWHPLEREIEGWKLATGQEWAEVCFVPTWAARSKKGARYRFLAIRELLGQKEFPGMEGQLPFPTLNW
jgi:hypothetical protein